MTIFEWFKSKLQRKDIIIKSLEKCNIELNDHNKHIIAEFNKLQAMHIELINKVDLRNGSIKIVTMTLDELAKRMQSDDEAERKSCSIKEGHIASYASMMLKHIAGEEI